MRYAPAVIIVLALIGIASNIMALMVNEITRVSAPLGIISFWCGYDGFGQCFFCDSDDAFLSKTKRAQYNDDAFEIACDICFNSDCPACKHKLGGQLFVAFMSTAIVVAALGVVFLLFCKEKILTIVSFALALICNIVALSSYLSLTDDGCSNDTFVEINWLDAGLAASAYNSIVSMCVFFIASFVSYYVPQTGSPSYRRFK